jgi:hypothetical protein
MRFILIILLSIFLFSICCNKDETSERLHNNAQKYTVLDVDNIKDTIKVPIEIIIDRDPKYEKYLKYIPTKKEECIGEIRTIVQGPDSTFYCADVKKNIVTQFSFNGKYEKLICITGSGPGECLKPEWMINYKNKIYLNDHFNYRLEILDINGNYIREIKNFKQVIHPVFFLFDDNKIMKCNDNYNDSPIIILDSLGNRVIKIGKKIDFGNDYRPIYKFHEEMIIAKKEGEDYFWFCYKGLPFIFKCDFDGNCIEEIKIVGSIQDERYKENKKDMVLYKNSNQFRFDYIIQDLQFINESLFISLTAYGIVELKIRNKEITKVTKWNFEHESQEYLNSFLNYCNFAVINSNIYCYSVHTIFRLLR